jgi:hypothetical protein
MIDFQGVWDSVKVHAKKQSSAKGAKGFGKRKKWCLVLGTWNLVLGTWYLVLGTWYLVLGTCNWILVLGT